LLSRVMDHAAEGFSGLPMRPGIGDCPPLAPYGLRTSSVSFSECQLDPWIGNSMGLRGRPSGANAVRPLPFQVNPNNHTNLRSRPLPHRGQAIAALSDCLHKWTSGALAAQMGASTTSGPGTAGVYSGCTLLPGLEVQSKSSGKVTFIGRKNALFAQPARFAHNGLAGGSFRRFKYRACGLCRRLRAR
jgi:hypothetical protein